MGSNKKWLLALIAILVIGIGVSAYFFVTRKPATTSQADTDETETQIAKITASSKDIYVVVKDDKTLATFATSLNDAAMAATLEGIGPYTVLAPTDAAFKALPASTLELLQKPLNKQQLTNVLNYHVIPGKLVAKDLTNGQRIKTVNGQELIVEVTDGTITFVDAKGGKAVVEKANVSASNGVVHIVNAVLLPQ